MDSLDFDVIIIGGGISGIYILKQLVSFNKNLRIRLFEMSPFLGGRIQTKKNKSNQVIYETGPWRFHNSHNRLLKIIKELDLEYKITSSSQTNSYHQKIKLCSDISKKKTCKQKYRLPGYSIYDSYLLDNNKCCGDMKSISSKIPLVMESLSSVYNVDNNYKGYYYVLTKGFSNLINNLSQAHNSCIQNNTKVIDIIYQKDPNIYQITYQQRLENKFVTKKITSKFVFLCLPPEYIQDWTISKEYLKPLINSVNTISLHHIYAYSKKLNNFFNNSFLIKTDSALGQIVSGDFNNNWFQISYSGGQIADFWNHVKLNSPSIFKNKLISHFNQLGFNKLEISKIESYYWKNAIHYWIPNFNFNLENNVNNSIYPNPICLPNLLYAGESFSSIQGWIEGALQTSELALNKFTNIVNQKQIFNELIIKKNTEYVLIDNLVIDIKKWKKVHPGSEKAIRNHLGEDISQLFRQINHKDYSWGIIYNLLIGYKYKNQLLTYIKSKI